MIFMKKMSQKNNKGFSLVELIVVVAIMAVLMGILVPTLVKNVEKSKKQKDRNAIEEIRNTMVTNLADPLYSDLEATIEYNDATGYTIDIQSPKTSNPTVASSQTLKDFLKAVNGDIKNWKFTSKDYKKKPKVTFVIKDQQVTVYRDAEDESVPGAGSAAATTTTVAP